MLIRSLGVYILISCLRDVASAASIARDAPSLTMPLRRRAAPKHTDPGYFASIAQNIRTKYNYGSSSRSLDRRQGSSGLPITNEQFDSSYSCELSIGTPAQTFNVVLDTGSSDLWLASTSCTQGCAEADTFNPSSSSSFSNKNQQVSIQYGMGAVEGVLATDSVKIGDFTASQGFLVTIAVSSGLLDSTLSGLLGLGFRSIANSGVTPFVEGLASGGSLSSPLMAMYLARFIDDQNARPVEQQGGSFTLGATNSSLFTGDIEYVDIPKSVTPGFWLLPVTGITVQGSAVSLSNGGSGSSSNPQLAAIDSGTTLIGGPSDAVAAVYEKIPGSAPGSGQLQGFYTYPCDTKVSVTLTLGGSKSWPISPVDFQLQAQSSDGSIICMGAIFDIDSQSTSPGLPRKRQSFSNPAWVIGDAFLKNVYTVFRYDPPSVGFAQLAANLPGANPAPGPAGGLNGVNSSSPSSSAAPSTSSPSTTFSPLSPVTSPVTSPARTSASADVFPIPSSASGNISSGVRLNIPTIGLVWVIGLAVATATILHW